MNLTQKKQTENAQKDKTTRFPNKYVSTRIEQNNDRIQIMRKIQFHSSFKHKMKRLQIPQKLVREKFYLHGKILRTRNCCRKFIKNLLPEKRKENM